MKLILSRKGFDSSAGGGASPIFPDGRMLSLPIPDKLSPVTYADITYEGKSLGKIVKDLTGGRIPPHYRAHIDPDLAPDRLPRLPEWRPNFGQMGSPQGHLRNNGVGPGDLFLFFGRFRRAEMQNGSFKWTRNRSDWHVIWGWLQVREVIEIKSSPPSGYEWAAYHPHFNRRDASNNVVYIACNHLQLDGLTQKLPGAGVFPRFSAELRLTAPDSNNLTDWELPGWFYPDNNRKPLTHNTNMKNWKKRGNRTTLRVAPRGQEFILNCDEYPEAIEWACNLIKMLK